MSKNEKKENEEIDYSDTLFLPKTEFPMRAGLPKREPEILEHWEKIDLYKKLRQDANGRPQYILHDGPPYANGNLHIGTAYNKIMKDVITRSFQMRGFDSNYVPGWDCHGLPIEWKVEEQYREKGKNKNNVEINEFRKECREFATYWLGEQRKEFKRLGVIGDFNDPYLTMSYEAEAIIADELMKFAMSGQIYRGSKPVMWSVVEQTALAEAEVEYEKYESDTMWAKFPVIKGKGELENASVVIWTTTPWTIPGNRAVCYSKKIGYSVYQVKKTENDFGPKVGEKLIFADSLVESCEEKAKLKLEKIQSVNAETLNQLQLEHPLKKEGEEGYEFIVPLLEGEHVTDDVGTGFVHTAPGHGADDFEIWMNHTRELQEMGIATEIPFTVDDEGYFTEQAPRFVGARVIDDKGKKGDANEKIIQALIKQDKLFARGRLKHDYPHSWRSKKPVIFRNTPQWFVYMDKKVRGATLREKSLKAIENTQFVPIAGQNRLRAMIHNRPDWVLSRQRAWGVPITLFRNIESEEIIPNEKFGKSEELIKRITETFKKEGADAWFVKDAKERFLKGIVEDVEKWEKVDDILDVWFDSGCTHAFCLEKRKDLKWPADMYLEGGDQHRGWFQSSLLESCATRDRAPYQTVLTHGFVMAEDGRKMSKSLNNFVAPQDIIKQSGADILRLWAVSSDYEGDLRIGTEILKTAVDAYRKLRNTLRWMLGTLAHDQGDEIKIEQMPELEQLVLHQLSRLDENVRKGFDEFDYKRVFAQLMNFTTIELSSFYFDIRKDALYCDPPSSQKRKAALRVVAHTFDCVTAWLAPMLVFTTEEAWITRNKEKKKKENIESVHLRQLPEIPKNWRNEKLNEKWEKIKTVRRVVTGALEVERQKENMGSSLQANPIVYVNNKELLDAIKGTDLAEICITSQIEISEQKPTKNAFKIDEVKDVAVVARKAEGQKCLRSWRVLPEVGKDKEFKQLSKRDADAMREIKARIKT